ncbi:MAG: tRNA (N(6)-L-threonylcarbamoyladenosine(37)-C(2))-methylthiotransferase MtaB [Balneolaceae bacterium]
MYSVAFETLGCKLNFSETSSIRRTFSENGFRITGFDDKADIYVINTCSVTADANSSCRKTVRRALRRNPAAFIAVIGCYAQLEPEEIAEIDGVDVVIGVKDKFRILDIFSTFSKQDDTLIYNSDVNEAVDFHNAFSSDDRTRAFLKIQDGCSYKCSFCTIPRARGKSRSPDIEIVMRSAEKLVGEGYREIVITGVNAGDFGAGRDENFYMLLQSLDNIHGLRRIRVSSVEPNLLHDSIIHLAAGSDKIQPHFHIPLQSGSDDMLGLMRRRYKTRLYRDRVELIRQLLPEACIGVDVIAGHPGETDKLFQESYEFLKNIDVSYLHVFTYSERPGTDALDLKPVVPVSVRKKRNRKLRQLSVRKRRRFNSRFTGTKRAVLFEGENKNGLIHGWTDNYIRVALPYRKRFENRILPVQLTRQTDDGLILGTIGREELDRELAIETLVDHG